MKSSHSLMDRVSRIHVIILLLVIFQSTLLDFNSNLFDGYSACLPFSFEAIQPLAVKVTSINENRNEIGFHLSFNSYGTLLKMQILANQKSVDETTAMFDELDFIF